MLVQCFTFYYCFFKERENLLEFSVTGSVQGPGSGSNSVLKIWLEQNQSSLSKLFPVSDLFCIRKVAT